MSAGPPLRGAARTFLRIQFTWNTGEYISTVFPHGRGWLMHFLLMTLQIVMALLEKNHWAQIKSLFA